MLVAFTAPESSHVNATPALPEDRKAPHVDLALFCTVEAILPTREPEVKTNGAGLTPGQWPGSPGRLVEPPRQRPRTLLLQKSSQDFGFTLRHFIVYPPGSEVLSSTDKENGNSTAKKSQYSGLEPKDTIFVKNVRENSPAQQAGLCEGDRLVKVNGQNILGKTYSQVMMLIQSSGNNLELCVLPKALDVLQKGVSKDVPKCKKSSLEEEEKLSEGPSHPHGSTKRTCWRPQVLQTPPGFTTSQQRPRQPPPTTAPASGWRGGLGSCGGDVFNPNVCCGRSSSAVNALDFHFFNHNAAIASATLAPPRRRWPQAEAPDQPAPSDGCNGLRASPCHPRRTYGHLGPALRPGPSCEPSPNSAEYHRRASLLCHQQAAAASSEPSWLQRQDAAAAAAGKQPWPKSLANASDEYERPGDTLANASPLSSYSKHSSTASRKTIPPSGFAATPPPTGPQPGQRAEPQTRRVKEKPVPAGRCQSFSVHGQIAKPAQSLREPGHGGPHPYWGPAEREQVLLTPPPSPAPPSVPEEETAVVSLRKKAALRGQNPAETLAQPPGTASLSARPHSSGSAELAPESPEDRRLGRTNNSLAQHTFSLVSSIPLIGNSKVRRCSYLLAVNTRRSKSFEDGLNAVRGDGHHFFKLPKRVKSFFNYGFAESLQPPVEPVETWPQRHSTSDLGAAPFSDVCKQGWLHCKHLYTENGKKAGGSLRPWKRVFSVLRAHSLFLYKDQREAVLQAVGPSGRPEDSPAISVRGCLVDIAYRDTRRKHTLRLTTQDLGEYLLQAEDQEDMMAWIQTIREKSRTDSEEMNYSLSLINKKLNDNRKHSLPAGKAVWSPRAYHTMLPFLLTKTDNSSINQVSTADEAVWSSSTIRKAKKPAGPKVFGIRLEDCQPAVNHKFVPLIVEICCGIVEASGLECTGIYRVPGNNAMVSNLQDYLNQGLDISTAAERWQDLNVISSVLKSFFRKLPEPLFTDDKYNDFIEANRIEDADNRLKTMNKLIQGLPSHHYHTLKFLVGHLRRVADHSEKNKMEPRNLALVFGPTLVRTSEDKMIDMVTHMPDRYKIVETLIVHYDWFFTNQCIDNKYKAPEDKQSKQAVPNIDHLLSNIGRTRMPAEGLNSTGSHSLKATVPRLHHDSKTKQPN